MQSIAALALIASANAYVLAKDNTTAAGNATANTTAHGNHTANSTATTATHNAGSVASVGVAAGVIGVAALLL